MSNLFSTYFVDTKTAILLDFFFLGGGLEATDATHFINTHNTINTFKDKQNII